MNTDRVQYKVTNTTKWPGATKGRHKNGFILQINRKNIHINQHTIVDEVTEGLEALQKRRCLKIEPMVNRHVTIREEVERTEKANELARKQAESQVKKEQKKTVDMAEQKAQQETEALQKAQQDSTPASSLDKQELKDAIRPENTAKVVNEGDSVDPLGDVEEPVDSNPNFVVQARRGGNKGNRNR